MEKIEKTADTNLLVYKKGYTPAYVKTILKKKGLDGLRIVAVLQENRFDNLDFLSEYGFLTKLHITSRDDCDFSFLEKMQILEDLSINIPGTSVIDLANQTNLSNLSINWRKQIQHISSCNNLKKLTLIEFREIDFSAIKSLKSLSSLSIKTSSIKTLAGIKELINLEYLSLGNCGSLKDIHDLKGLGSLKELKFDICSRLRDFSSLSVLSSLEVLQIDDCKKIKSIEFVVFFPKLRKLTLLGNTDVEDGNLANAKSLDVYYTPRKHYNIIIKNKTADKIKTANIAKLTSLFGKRLG